MFTRRLKSSRRVESTSTSRGKLTGGADGFPRPPPDPDWLHAGTLLRIGDVVRIQSPVQGKLKRKKKLNKYQVYFFGLQCPMSKDVKWTPNQIPSVKREQWHVGQSQGRREKKKQNRKKCQEKQQMAPNEKESCWECFFI